MVLMEWSLKVLRCFFTFFVPFPLPVTLSASVGTHLVCREEEQLHDMTVIQLCQKELSDVYEPHVRIILRDTHPVAEKLLIFLILHHNNCATNKTTTQHNTTLHYHTTMTTSTKTDSNMFKITPPHCHSLPYSSTNVTSISHALLY